MHPFLFYSLVLPFLCGMSAANWILVSHWRSYSLKKNEELSSHSSICFFFQIITRVRVQRVNEAL